MYLVIEAKERRIFGACFENDQMVDAFTYALPLSDEFLKRLEGKTFEKILIAPTRSAAADAVKKILPAATVMQPNDFAKLWQERPPLTADRIANIYGALYHFPSNDCIIIDLGETMRCDYVTSQGQYLGGAVFAFPASVDRPADVLTDEQATGSYFGLLGAAERIVAELRATSASPSTVMVIATGLCTTSEVLSDDLSDFVDATDPYLAMYGLNEILKEK